MKPARQIAVLKRAFTDLTAAWRSHNKRDHHDGPIASCAVCIALSRASSVLDKAMLKLGFDAENKIFLIPGTRKRT